MLRRRTFAFLSLLLVAACSDDEAAPRSGDEAPDLSGVVYAGATTDEALERLLDVTPKDDPRHYVTIDAPDLSAPLSAASPATFQYHLATQAFRAPTPAPRAKGAPAVPGWQRSLREVLKLFGPPRVAHAHGTPFNGTGYFLVFHAASGAAVLRVFTSNQSYTPDADAWQRLASAPQPLTLQITSAFFEDNDVPSDGGPFVGGSFDFAIQ